jgi:uncharacterized protein (DUF362 family)
MSADPRPHLPVAVVSRPGADYPAEPPFDPPNPIYEMVEVALRNLGLDQGRVGTPEWNPLGDVIAPGDRVVIKPNFVASKNFHQVMRGERLACSSTHGSVLRPIVDYALRAAGPRGVVSIVDTPVEGCNIEQVLRGLGIEELLRYYRERGQSVDFFDLRKFQVVPRMVIDNVQRHGRSWNLGLLVRKTLPGDPRGSTVIDLGARSRFAPVEHRGRRYRFHRSHLYTPVPHHTGGRHEYSLPRTVLEADAILNIAKMKTHKKSGVTMALKAVIGLCDEKYWLPHYTAGTPWEDGDEYPSRPPLSVRVENQLQRFPLPGNHSLIARAPELQAPQNGMVRGYILEGSWEGNDTIWRTTLDLHDLVLHADRSGRVHDTPQRRYLAFVDGIIAGEGEGPLAATPRHAGLLCAARDPVLLDLVGTRLMGFVPQCVPTVWQALARPLLATSREELLRQVTDGPLPAEPFRPPTGWGTLGG